MNMFRFGKKLKPPSVFQIKYQLLTMWLADQRNKEVQEAVDSATPYRRRADALAVAVRNRSPVQKHRLLKKQAALYAMADNEDWLNGKSGSPMRGRTELAPFDIATPEIHTCGPDISPSISLCIAHTAAVRGRRRLRASEKPSGDTWAPVGHVDAKLRRATE